jgi:chromosome segregation ATPase
MPFYRTDRHGNNNNKRNDSMYELLLAKSTTTAVPPSSDRHLLYSPSRVPRSTVSASPTTKTGMVQLVQMFHKTLQDQQARAHERMQQLESLLEEERSKRQDIQRTQQVTMSRLDTFMKKYQEQRTPPSPTLSAATSSPPTSPSLASHCNSTRHRQQQRQQPFDEWTERINRLETSVENESQSRHRLQQSMVDTVERLDALKRSVSQQAHEHSTSRRHLEKQINQALTNLSILTQQNQQRKR